MSFRVRGHVIMADPMSVLSRLLIELQSAGIGYLRELRRTGDDCMVCCPWHNDGNERQPSCGVCLDGPNAGKVHCFTCGKVATLPEFVSHCFGHEDGGKFGERWLFQRFVSFEDDGVRRLPPLGQRPREGLGCIIDGEGGRVFQGYHPYMDQRKITPEVRAKFHVGYDPETDCLTFPCWDERGRYVCTTRRSCHSKVFDIPKGIEKPVYGLNLVEGDAAYVCESVINCLTLWGWGHEAIALFGLGTEGQYGILRRSGIRKFVLCFDGDDAGRRGRERFERNLGNAIIVGVGLPPGKDVNDLSKEEFEALPRTLSQGQYQTKG